jgi:hypothetical protein
MRITDICHFSGFPLADVQCALNRRIRVSATLPAAGTAGTMRFAIAARRAGKALTRGRRSLGAGFFHGRRTMLRKPVII